MSQAPLDRRRLIKAIVKGMVYTAPVITSMAAPAGLMGQGPSAMMMFCDYFPVLCMIFGGGAEAPSTPRMAPTTPTPPPPTPPAPTPPSPSQANPPPGR